MPSQFTLFCLRRFLPLFLVQFLGAFNDNLMKTTVVMLVAYGLWDIGGMNSAVLVSLAAAVFILPFILFCPLAGELTDKYDKARIIKWVKVAEIGVVILGLVALYFQSTILAFLVLFGLGAQSAFFSPAKYSILPQHLRDDELVAGNGLVSSGTYLAILSGTVLGALLALSLQGIMVISAVLLSCAVFGYWASLFVPAAPSGGQDVQININPVRGFSALARHIWAQPRGVFLAVLGVSWFYFVAGTYHAQFPNYATHTLGVDHIVLTVFLIIFSVGVTVGGMLNNLLLKSEVSLKYVPWALIGVAVFSADLFWVSLPYAGHGDGSMVTGFWSFIRDWSAFKIMFDLFFLSVCGGLYVVPLRSYVQHHAVLDQKARVVAANSVTDAVFILISALLAAVFLSFGLYVIDLFLILAVACLAVALYFLQTGRFSGE